MLIVIHAKYDLETQHFYNFDKLVNDELVLLSHIHPMFKSLSFAIVHKVISLVIKNLTEVNKF